RQSLPVELGDELILDAGVYIQAIGEGGTPTRLSDDWLCAIRWRGEEGVIKVTEAGLSIGRTELLFDEVVPFRAALVGTGEVFDGQGASPGVDPVGCESHALPEGAEGLGSLTGVKLDALLSE